MLTINRAGNHSPAVNTAHAAETPPALNGDSSSRPSSPTSSTLAPFAPILPRRSSVASSTQTSSAARPRVSLPSTSEGRHSPPGPAIGMQLMQRPGSHNATANAQPDSESHASGAQVHQQTLASKLMPHVSPGLETGASVTSIASAAAPAYAKPFGVASGGMWAASGLVGLATNEDHDTATYAASALNTTAGVAQVAVPLLSGRQQVTATAVSAATWAASGAMNMAKAGYDLYKGHGSVASNVANGVSGVFNLGGAVAEGASIALAGTPAAFPAAIASGSLWLAAAAAQHLGAAAQQRYSVPHQTADIETPLDTPVVSAATQSDVAPGHIAPLEASQSNVMPGGMGNHDAD